MKYPEYDSPFELVMSEITTKCAKQIDKECLQAIQRVGINVDKEKMLTALRHDAERYREAYAKGHETGYTKRDEEIIRCKDCKHFAETQMGFPREEQRRYVCDEFNPPDDWFCADGERRTDDA